MTQKKYVDYENLLTQKGFHATNPTADQPSNWVPADSTAVKAGDPDRVFLYDDGTFTAYLDRQRLCHGVAAWELVSCL